jgi:Family of unknown function (DUF5677)
MDFEFGQTIQSEAFFERNPRFFQAFGRLVALSNECFGRVFQAKNSAEDLYFNLGQTCRDEFLEVAFLATNGYGIGALKLLRGLYERAVVLAYVVKHPEKAQRFVNFAAIQEYKAIKVGLEIVPETELDVMMATKGTTVARAKELYEKYKPDFQITVCKRCQTKETAFSWDIDLSSMVREVGESYKELYLGAYVLPNLHVHASLASTFPSRPSADEIATRNRDEAKFALLVAMRLLLLVIQSQDCVFALGLGDSIGSSNKDVAELVA